MKVSKNRVMAVACAAIILATACERQSGNKSEEPYKADLSTLEGQWRDSVHTALSHILSDKKIVIGEYSMPIWWTIYGDEPSDGRSLYISLHGGGGAPAEVNDSQWDNQKKLYKIILDVFYEMVE